MTAILPTRPAGPAGSNAPHAEKAQHPNAADLLRRYREVRTFTESLTETLETEDFVLQTMPDVSPTKWHLAHTSWFFETFILGRREDYKVFHPTYAYLFNSYYITVGDRHCRIKRGTIGRPTVGEVFDYRRYVDRHVEQQLSAMDGRELAQVAPLMEVGLNHEQQHQELLITDIKHVFSCNPLYPVFRERSQEPVSESRPLRWRRVEEGVREVGHAGDGFAYDNETPRHKTYVQAFELADRPVTNGEFLQFIEAGGYQTHSLWLSEAWASLQADPVNWSHPFYWHKSEKYGWQQFTLSGMVPLDPNEPVCHLSFYEADAYARWAGARLPTEFEWEIAADELGVKADDGGTFADDLLLHPRPTTAAIVDRHQSLGTGSQAAGPIDAQPSAIDSLLGNVWEWTGSQYRPYPRYRPPEGALGEYNGKFMCGQFVLRGGSCATPRSHIRTTYRNFFHPDARWQFSGVRLARDVG